MSQAEKSFRPDMCLDVSTKVRAFPDHERRLLLGTQGIGEVVVSRLENEGVHCLRDLVDRGVEQLVEQICLSDGNPAWRNRRRALSRALASLQSAKLGDR